MTPAPRLGGRRLQTAAVVGALIFGVVIGGGLVPLVGTDVVDTTATGTPSVFGTASGGAGSGSAGGDGSVPGASSAPGGESVDGASPGGPTPGGTGGTATGTESGAPTATGTPGSDQAGPPVPLTATDVGVTADVIRIGAQTQACRACANVGVGTSSVSHALIVRAFVDDINARGGIHGRTVEVFTADYDPVQDAVSGGGTQRAGCLELTERRQVFAIVHGATGSTNGCVYNEHATPLITTFEGGFDPETFNDSEGRLWTIMASNGRILVDWARQLVARGLLTPDTRYGIVTEETGDSDAVVDRYLASELTRLGMPPTHVAVMPQNTAVFPTSAAQQVAAMRAAGVNTVLYALNIVSAGLFTQAAERDGWRPQYLVSEFPNGANDFSGGQHPASFEGAIAISTTPERSQAEVRADPESRRCLDIFEQAAGRPAAYPGEFGPVFMYCRTVQLFELAATIAGPNLTRESFVRALAQVGRVAMPDLVGSQATFGGAYGLGPVKWSGADLTNVKVWTTACPRDDDNDGRCWVITSSGTPMDV
jgi:hypothetical protein